MTYDYDEANRLVEIGADDLTGTFNMTYDEGSRRESLTYPNGVVTTYSYNSKDLLNRILTMKDTTVLSDIEYTDFDGNANRLQKVTLAGTEVYEYDDINQLVKTTYNDASVQEFIYDKNGNRLTFKDRGIDFDAEHNELNQLLLTTTGQSVEGLTIALQGLVYEKNILSVKINGQEADLNDGAFTLEGFSLEPGQNQVTIEALDKAGNVTTETFNVELAGAARAYAYDKNGNRVQKTEGGVIWNYSWDSENRLVKVQRSDGLVVEYGYYDDGRRSFRRVSLPEGHSIGLQSWLGQDLPGVWPSFTAFIYDGYHEIAEYDDVWALQKEYLYNAGIDEIIATSEDDTYSFYHQDGLNSVILITDEDGEEIAAYEYDVFGALASESGMFENDVLYTGRWLDRETGDYYYRARYYDAVDGRFLSRDPIGYESREINLFVYTKNNSINFNDPSGLKRKPLGESRPCGTGLTSLIVPQQPPFYPFICWDFKPACQNHDRCYAKLGRSREFCDWMFKHHMDYICKSSKGLKSKVRSVCHMMKNIYYAAVRAAGRGPYERAQAESMDRQNSL